MHYRRRKSACLLHDNEGENARIWTKHRIIQTFPSQMLTFLLFFFFFFFTSGRAFARFDSAQARDIPRFGFASSRNPNCDELLSAKVPPKPWTASFTLPR